ncbi:Ornithine cyclodeaminase [Catenulispora acidiphila DSM 44928]|uniref:Ornithine cyclodeaminase n=1 Tax=Catenulispora acidiphila (strain DSM 44928 / JCM 14897 / NBRC 102108 / NRRL B-24433 / ID139908) TaxID=479433 RepID=C7QEK5_CATAD|nr:ornithine cyclodeaminase family protein [Catenulispora acidiphila]ACU70896.1 Ornithine cyclodeaminase [Catenulispora acidiphila DSM 44928]
MSTASNVGLPIFDAAEIRAAVGFEDLVEPVARAFADYSQGLGESPVSVFAPAGRDGDVHVKSAWLPGSPIFVVKVGSWFAERARLTGNGASGMILAFDAQTGDPVALLRDDHHLSDVRTAAAGALATRLLARQNSSTIGVLGTGVQAYLQVLEAAAERPITSVRIWGRRAEPAQRVATALRRRLPGVDVLEVPTAREACAGVDILITATGSTQPLVEPDWLAPGTHVTSIGADDAGKVELAPGCLARADLVVVDSRQLTVLYGDLAYAQHAGVRLKALPTELGDLIAGRTPGRAADEQITVCKLIGLGVQDLAAANTTLERLNSADAPNHSDDSPAPHRQPASAVDLSWR